ncbi:hypothetical protein BDZ97DRAFT_1913343 [Flammula alnicola]|nr:hypothetical protein BDZ97DRAFT_1913343 [Flammula alnicola]
MDPSQDIVAVTLREGSLQVISDDEARHNIDKEIQHLYESIRALKSRRNMHSPISKLPAELFATIFALSREEMKSRAKPWRWIKLTHVCRQWREMANNFPSLWTSLPFDRPRWVTEMVKRSQTARLSVNADLSSRTWLQDASFESLQNFLGCHLSRVQDIYINQVTAEQLATLFGDLPSTSVPHLRSLRVIESKPANTTPDVFIDPIALVEKCLRDTDSLKRVEVACMVPGWDSALLRGLTHLTIHNHGIVQRPSQGQLISALRRMPSLQLLHLHGIVLPKYESSATTTVSVHLSKLESLLLTDTTLEVGNFLGQIRFPPTVRIHLECTGWPRTRSDFSNVLSYLRGLYSTPQSTNPMFRSLQITPSQIINRPGQISSPLTLQFTAWTSFSESTDPAGRFLSLPTTPPSVVLSLRWYSHLESPIRRDEMRNVLTDVCQTLPCQSLAVLALESNGLFGEIEPDTFIHSLGTQPELHSVHLTGNVVKPFLLSLSSAEHGQGPSTLNLPHTTSLPSLCYISIRRAQFDPSHKAGLPIDTLYDYLKRRAELSVGLDRVDLEECVYLSADDVAVLDEVVTVVWDNVEVECEEDLVEYEKDL